MSGKLGRPRNPDLQSILLRAGTSASGPGRELSEAEILLLVERMVKIYKETQERQAELLQIKAALQLSSRVLEDE